MSLSFNDYLQLLNSGIYRQRAKVQLLRYSDLSVYKEITGDILNDSGSLSIERTNGIRRVCNFSLINSTITEVAKYKPSIENLFLSPRQPIKLWLGLANEHNEEYLISQGIFYLADPQISSSFSQSIVELSLMDSFSIFSGDLGGELNRTFIVTLGSNIYNAINSILQTENYYPLPCILDSVYASETTPYTITKEASETFGSILIDLAYLLSANLYFDKNGSLRFEKDINDITRGSIFDFTTENAQYLGGTVKYNYTDFFNSVLVIGSNVEGSIYSYEATNTNLLSPTSVNNIGFKRQKRIEDENINSTQLAQDRAEFELRRLVAIENEVSITSIPLYHLDVNSKITLTDANFGFNKEPFLINSITLPFNVGSQMTINAIRAIDLPFNDS